jgi:hypothetical protein
MRNGNSQRQRTLRNQRQSRLRRRRKLGFREAPFLYNLEMLDALVELRAVSQAVADSGDDRLIGQTVSNWVLNYARAKRGLRDLDLRLLGLW